jgi:UDP-N-acetylmuramoyl-L-alanyl-D-glutamate--2,6-diaminopimelate ligase
MPVFTQLTPAGGPRHRLSGVLPADARVLGPVDDPVVTSVTVEHAEVVPGAVFAALPGRARHGADFAPEAAARGAVAVLTDGPGAARAAATGLPVVVVTDPRAALGVVAAAVYGTDRAVPQLFGVTGTNGKTTTVHVLDAVLRQLGVPSGLSSTADRRSGDRVVASRLTSPEAPELHALLARMVEDGVRAAALEVSAQALTRRRVDGLRFEVAGFTNLSHDHLDDYGDLAAYLEAKLALFTPERSRRAVVLLDSPGGREVARRATVPVTTVASVGGGGDGVPVGGAAEADWTVAVDAISASGTSFHLVAADGRSLSTSVPLIGRHMAADAGLALVMLLEAGHDLELVRRAVRGGVDVVVPGRTLQVSGAHGPRVYTDFSHTPDSVEKTLDGLRAITDGRLVAVIGADGDRDPSKRELMGRAAAQGADLVIVTDHHPRTEEPARIRDALLRGARAEGGAGRVEEVADPGRAIRRALADAAEGDTVLWVGPGDTDYRLVAGEEVAYSPRRDARAALEEAGWGAGPGEPAPAPGAARCGGTASSRAGRR